MKPPPDIRYVDEGFDLTGPTLYETVRRGFGEARSLHPLAFRSKRFADLEDEKVWTRAWVCVGPHQRIPRPGDLLPFTVGNHGIHVQRDEDGGLVGRFNKAQQGTCRQVPVQCQTGRKTKCYYTACGHSRDRDVILAGVSCNGKAEIGQYLGFDPADLAPVQVATLGPLVFVNLDFDPQPFGDQMGDIPKKFGGYLNADLRHVARQSLEFACNWKLAGRAFLERRCLPGSPLYEPASVGSPAPGTVEKHFGAYWCHGADLPPGFGEATAGLPEIRGLRSAQRKKAFFCWIYPNALVAFLPNHVVAWTLQPTSLTDHLQHMDVFVHAAANGEADAAARRLVDLWGAWRRTEMEKLKAEQIALSRPDAVRLLPLAEANGSGAGIEENYLAYRFQTYFVDRLLARHGSVWNDAATNSLAAVLAPGSAAN